MQIFRVILASAVIGMVVGAAVAYFEVQPAARSAASSVAPSGKIPEPAPDEPRVEVDEPNYQFGSMQRGTTKSHEFIFSNTGPGPLTLRVGSTSCKCTLGSVAQEPLQQGESVPVKLEWSALTGVGAFRQTASIITNDPRHTTVNLSVEGTVTEAGGVEPPDFLFDKVAAGNSKSAEVYVMALTQDSLEVSEPTLTAEDSRQYFDVKIEHVDPDVLPDPAAKDGVRVTVTANPGLPLGRFDQWLTVKTDIPEAEQLKIPVIGQVVGNISVHGRMWSDEGGALRFGHVESSEGASETLNLVIRGDGADKVKIKVASVDPPELHATVGAPNVFKPTLVHVPLVIEIPPGTPPMARLDTQQHDEARITLETTHPDAPQMVLGVRFAVER